MPNVKVEPSGCHIHKGKVQVRFSFYLEPSDARYSEHHVQRPIIPPEGYQGEMTTEGKRHPVDIDDYNNWRESLPKKWQNNPFHNHFIFVEPDTTDEEIMDVGEVFLEESYGKWEHNETPNPKNKPVKFLEVVDKKRQKALEAKVKHLKNTALERTWL